MKGIFKSRLRIVDGKVSYIKESDKTKYEEFLKELPEGTELSILIEVQGKEKTNAQLAILHKYIHIISSTTGDTFTSTKQEIKRKTGLFNFDNSDEMYKSFADCSVEDINLAIQSCIELGDFLGINLRIGG